jgi:hypothetical protein
MQQSPSHFFDAKTIQGNHARARFSFFEFPSAGLPEWNENQFLNATHRPAAFL